MVVGTGHTTHLWPEQGPDPDPDPDPDPGPGQPQASPVQNATHTS